MGKVVSLCLEMPNQQKKAMSVRPSVLLSVSRITRVKQNQFQKSFFLLKDNTKTEVKIEDDRKRARNKPFSVYP